MALVRQVPGGSDAIQYNALTSSIYGAVVGLRLRDVNQQG